MLAVKHFVGVCSVWLACCVRDAEAGGSNPLTSTIFLFSMIQSFMAGFFCIALLPEEPQAFTANHRPNREFRKNKICRNFKIVVRICRKSPLL